MRKVRDLLRQRRLIAIALVTLVTLGLIGVVVATTTSVGCSFTKSLAVRSKQCASTSVATVVTPSPTARPSAFQPIPSPEPPYDPGTSSIPPYNPGASSYPPYYPGASAGDPYTGPASGT